MGTLVAIAITIVILGFLWFYIARPILEDYGVLAPREAVNHYQDNAPVVMSRSEDEQPPIAASSLQTDARQTPDRPMIPKPTPEQWLTLYALMRRHGIKRDDAGAAFRAAGLSLDNNTWSKAQPPEPAQVTPIAQRPTDAEFPEDRELLYEAPPR